MKKLRVFRVQPSAFDALVKRASGASNRSDVIRRALERACRRPPDEYPRRGLKPDLKSFSVFLDDAQAKALRGSSQVAGVSLSVFVEAALLQA